MKDNSLPAILLGVLVLIAVGAVLSLLQSVLLPFVIAMFLSVIFRPLIDILRKKHVPMALALIAVMIVIAGVLFGLSMIVIASAESFSAALPRYEAKMQLVLSGTLAWIGDLAATFGVRLQDVKLSDAVSAGSLASVVSASLGSVITLLSNLFLVLIFMIFMLSGSGQLVGKIRAAFPAGQSERIAGVLEHINAKVRRYMITKTLINLLSGAVAAGILALLGIDFPLLWGFLLFLLGFIPNIGSLVATVFPVALAILQFDTPARALLALVLLVVAQNLIGNLLEPKLMAFSLNLSPLLIIASLIFWGWLWGIWGMILAIPVMATVKIIFEHIEPLSPVAVLMSGTQPKAP